MAATALSLVALVVGDVISGDRFRVHELDDLVTSGSVHVPDKQLLRKVQYSETDGNSVAHGKFKPQGNDQGATYHDYFVPYERAFLGMPRNLTMLNVGVLAGHSLRTYAKFFGPAARVVGFDINLGLWKDSLARGVATPSNIETVEGSSWDSSMRDMLRRRYGQFELIIDDGCHEIDCMEKTFANLFPLLRPGGIYIAEDSPPLPTMLQFIHSIQFKPHSLSDKDKRGMAVETVTFGTNYMMLTKHQPRNRRRRSRDGIDRHGAGAVAA